MLFLLTLMYNFLSFALLSFATLTETSLQDLKPGYKCGNDFFEEKFLLDSVKQSSLLKEYRGHIKFGTTAYIVAIPNPQSSQLPCYIIVDSNIEIISVISPSIIDSRVDAYVGDDHKPVDYNRLETFIDYRKCWERPVLRSISSPTGGFRCDFISLRTQDAIKAAYSVRKIYKKNKKPWHKSLSFGMRPRPSPGPTQFDRNLSQYTAQVTAEGNLDPNGLISITLDKNFNVIGATLRGPHNSKRCLVSSNEPPVIIGHDAGRGQRRMDGYKCQYGYLKALYILMQASEATKAFEVKEKNPEEKYPKLYSGGLFPEASQPLFYIPSVDDAGTSLFATYIVVTRSCDVVGVLQDSPDGFKICEKKFAAVRAKSFSMYRSNRLSSSSLH